jgi:hypothetical protein
VTNLQIVSATLISRLAVALTATTSASIISAFRIRSVEIWGPPAADLVPVTVSCEFLNPLAQSGFGTRRFVHTDTSVGATRVAHVLAKPLPGTPCAAWQNVVTSASTTNGAAFILNMPLNGILDIKLDLVLLNNDPPPTGPTGTAMVPGTLVYNSLDGGTAGILRIVSGLPNS